MKMNNLTKLTFLIFSFLIVACSSTDYYPKPTGYNHIELPEHEYQTTDPKYPYSFEYSKNAKLTDDTSGFHKDYWLEITYPTLNFNVHLTYYPVDSNLNTLINDSYRLANNHDVKAYSIESEAFVNKSGNNVTYFQLEGDVPTTFQFFTHDSTSHFLRGAMYYPKATKNDSLTPVSEYVIEDIKHLLNTLSWGK